MYSTFLGRESHFSLQPALQDLLLPDAFLSWTLVKFSFLAFTSFNSSSLFVQLSFSHNLDTDDSVVSPRSNALEAMLLWNNQPSQECFVIH